LSSSVFAPPATVYSQSADVYSVMGNSKNAQLYYEKSDQIITKNRQFIGLASVLLNAGDE
jgi:hypothetical protein